MTELRTRRKWSRQSLADKTGYSLTYISGVELGHRNPSLEMIQAIAEVFGLRPSQLLAQAERKQARR